jgi:DnaJ-class molecular chaperone
MADYYELLGISAGASATEVRQAYLRLAREKHPDRFTDAEERARAQELFKELTTAFNTLSNPRERREYDEQRARPQPKGAAEIAADAYERGLLRHEARQYHEAVELLRTSVFHAPEEPRYHAALAQSLARNPHWAREAVQEAERAVRLQPNAASYHVLLAELLLGQGLKLRARRAAENALRLQPGSAAARRVLAEAGGDGDPGAPSPSGGLKGLLRRKP